MLWLPLEAQIIVNLGLAVYAARVRTANQGVSR